MNKRIYAGLLAMMFIISSLGFVIATDPILNVTSPVEGAYLDLRIINLSATADQLVDFFLFRNVLRSRRAVNLNDSVMSTTNTFRAREGSNTIRVKVLNMNGESDSKDISFIVDTRAPRISRTEPRNNEWVNAQSLFTVNYREDNLDSVRLVYNGTIEPKTDCTSGRKKTCSIMPNLTSFDGKDLLYHFQLFDKAGNNATSQVRIVHVDTTLPVISNVSTSVDRRRVTFTVEVEEENFDKILMRDNNARRPRWTRLCSRLNVGVCTKTKTFRTGTHNIDLMLLDEAGNSDSESVPEFVI